VYLGPVGRSSRRAERRALFLKYERDWGIEYQNNMCLCCLRIPEHHRKFSYQEEIRELLKLNLFVLLRLKFAQFGEEFSNHEWTPIDTN
jgi:hypothetical protein